MDKLKSPAISGSDMERNASAPKPLCGGRAVAWDDADAAKSFDRDHHSIIPRSAKISFTNADAFLPRQRPRIAEAAFWRVSPLTRQ
ncbi:hypothetical protein PE067_08915 [Paracoccus sp. DMF-8]|uniref:hypothetical protein n=1 Tax=Paracoccus sp. DMF-8 TaxID=3019445 RepID=UPI0023E871C7|nr:hypothetical protein [Paracoccus sp. DMF-8]MDF3606243.1 hypothetical protein [Paracoccus sp. DMF-8]